MAFEAVVVTRSYEQVVHQIEDQIRDGRLARGQKLPTERELGASFGVSRGVVREAVKVLGAMGLIEARQGSGLFVRNDPLPSITRALVLSVAPEEGAIGHLFEFRQALEVLAARAAAARRSRPQAAAIVEAAEASARAADAGDGAAFSDADALFHAELRAAAANPYLDTMLAAVRQMQTDVVRFFIDIPGSIAVAAAHHRRIAAAVAGGDEALAAAAMEEHITYTARMVGGMLRESATGGERRSPAED